MTGRNTSTAVPIWKQKSNSIKGKGYICKSGTRRGKGHEIEKEETREDQKEKRTKKNSFLELINLTPKDSISSYPEKTEDVQNVTSYTLHEISFGKWRLVQITN